MLRLMALAYLELENGVLALQCVQTQRTLPLRLSEQHSVLYQALQALLLLGRTQDAETELQAVISHQVCFYCVWTAARPCSPDSRWEVACKHAGGAQGPVLGCAAARPCQAASDQRRARRGGRAADTLQR